MSREEFKIKTGFNLCEQNNVTNGTGIYLDEYTPYLQFYYWIWLFPLLSLIHIILQTLELMSKTDFMSKLFGPLVTLLEFVLGPKITNDASDNDQNDENEIILI